MVVEVGEPRGSFGEIIISTVARRRDDAGHSSTGGGNEPVA
jgi:hypothetical protein